jgi:hypothetical protein
VWAIFAGNRELIQSGSMQEGGLIRGLMTDDEWVHFDLPYPSWRPTVTQPSSHARRGVLVADRRSAARSAGGIR